MTRVQSEAVFCQLTIYASMAVTMSKIQAAIYYPSLLCTASIDRLPRSDKCDSSAS